VGIEGCAQRVDAWLIPVDIFLWFVEVLQHIAYPRRIVVSVRCSRGRGQVSKNRGAHLRRITAVIVSWLSATIKSRVEESVSSRKGSEVFGWSRSQIPNNTGSRSRIFCFLSDSGTPIESIFYITLQAENSR